MPAPADSPPEFEPRSLLGSTLDGRYELVEHLASGGMGAVFRARHVHLRKDVAVKVLRPELTWSPDIVERFRREAEIASALEHDHLVRVTDFGRTEEGLVFLAMELLTGESLFDRLRREGFLSPETAVPILAQICSGLEAAHAIGVVHRDLKPENVFLARTASGREVAKLLDFGIAKLADAAGSPTQAGIVVGTPEYLSPEQAMGGPVDGRADLYAVGLIAWRALAGRHPFKVDDARALLVMQASRPLPPVTEARPALAEHPALVEAVARACEKDPSARPPTAAALREALVLAMGPGFAMPAGPTPSPPRPAAGDPAAAARAHAARAQLARSGAAAERAPSAEAARATPALPSPPPPAGVRPPPLPGAPPSPPPPSRRARLAALAGRAAALARARPAVAAATAAALLLSAAALAAVGWQRGRAASEARALLDADRAGEARAIVEAALEARPRDGELLLLRGRALHRLSGKVAEGIEAYAAARELGPLDELAHEDLVADLGRDRALADRAARVLRDEGERALPAVVRAAETARGLHRLRALAALRDLGGELRVDPARAYGELLADGDCDVRRAAARRLGEIGDAAALARLRRAALATTETRGLFGARTEPACGAAEADAAARRIEAARLP